jgi:hypothetical protein
MHIREFSDETRKATALKEGAARLLGGKGPQPRMVGGTQPFRTQGTLTQAIATHCIAVRGLAGYVERTRTAFLCRMEIMQVLGVRVDKCMLTSTCCRRKSCFSEYKNKRSTYLDLSLVACMHLQYACLWDMTRAEVACCAPPSEQGGPITLHRFLGTTYHIHLHIGHMRFLCPEPREAAIAQAESATCDAFADACIACRADLRPPDLPSLAHIDRMINPGRSASLCRIFPGALKHLRFTP